MTLATRNKLLNDYWAAHAQFGPLDVTPDQFIAMFDDKSAGQVVEFSEANDPN